MTYYEVSYLSTLTSFVIMVRFLTYTKVHLKEEADELIQLLTSASIPFEVEHDKDILDKIYIGEALDPFISINIPEDKFEDVNTLLREHAKTQFQNLNPDYYLFQFNNAELLSVITNPNEWNPFDQGIAEKLLAERNIETKQSIATRSAAVYKPLHVEGIYVVLQYLFSTIVPYVGIVIGLATLNAYRTLSNGQQIKMYDDEARMHGKAMLAIGVVRTIVTFYFNYLN